MDVSELFGHEMELIFFKSFVDGWTMGECTGINLLVVSCGCKFAFLNIKKLNRLFYVCQKY